MATRTLKRTSILGRASQERGQTKSGVLHLCSRQSQQSRAGHGDPGHGQAPLLAQTPSDWQSAAPPLEPSSLSTTAGPKLSKPSASISGVAYGEEDYRLTVSTVAEQPQLSEHLPEDQGSLEVEEDTVSDVKTRHQEGGRAELANRFEQRKVEQRQEAELAGLQDVERQLQLVVLLDQRRAQQKRALREEEEARETRAASNERRRRKGVRECAVCMEEKELSNLVQASCSHWYCIDELREALENSLKGRQLFQCCGKSLEQEAISQLLPPDAQERYALLALELACKDPVHCSNSKCSRFLPLDQCLINADVLRCPWCRRRTCRHCQQVRHRKLCEQDKGLEEVRQMATRMSWRACPRCSNMVQRFGGCPHITCRCGCHFCYRCGRKWILCAGACPV